MGQTLAESTEILHKIQKMETVSRVIVIGKDGFVIESVGGDSSSNVDELGSSLALAVNGMEKVSSDLKLGGLINIIFEYENALLIGLSTKDAVIVVFASDTSALGMLRIKLNSLLPEMQQLF